MKPIVPASHFLGIRGSPYHTGGDIARIIGFGILVLSSFAGWSSSGRHVGDHLIFLVISGLCIWYGIRPAFTRKKLANQAAPIAEKFALSGQDAIPFASIQSGRDDMSSDAFVRMLLHKRIMRNVMVDDQNGCFVLMREHMQVPQSMPPVQVVTVPIVQQSAMRTCPRCGAGVDAGARFCPSCGHAFYCQGCGHELAGDEAFCPNCGSSI